ncbi:helix-turn-helix transcriptional regulator [Streptomyces sp. AK08-02]|uniref:helix-turn-helix transcriptional regulator n=1 Tax=Streptomyces sp. AK08-02 TaxID=3028654 RepID=UPI0029B811DF|nr:AAA family ATPase [Streptomyces sp. AK08-02]MDX3751014.1 AAA family ATPase [Streptomyces sp. AK08-02]
MAEPYGEHAAGGRRAPLVSRSAEIRRLDHVLDGMRKGGGGPAVVDITGEAGIGKSRLMGELCSRAGQRGMTVLRGRATEYEQHIPFQPFTDAIADLDPRVLASFPALAEVAPMLYGAAREPSPGRSEVDRFGLHRATAGLLNRIGGSGLLVALDDMHWADPAALELLDHLVRHPVRASVVVVVARRARQTPVSLDAALTRGVDTGAVLRMGLGPLAEHDCVEGLTPDLPRGEALELYAASEGNPLYFLTLLQAHRAGAPMRTLSKAGLGSLLLDELTPLTPEQRRVVEAVTALGEHATPSMLALVTGRTDAELNADLGILARRDLLRTGCQGRLTLRHPVLRTLVHDSTDPWVRTGIHRLATAELARVGAPLAERAHHAERSLTGWDPQAAAVLTEAAEQAAQTAPASCAHWLEVVLRHLPHTPEHRARRRDLMLLRARALGVCGGLRESRDLLHEVIALAGRQDDTDTDTDTDTDADAGVRASAVVLCAVMERHLGRYAEAVALLRRELSRSPEPSPSATVALGMELGSSAPHHTSYPTVRAEIARTLSVARVLGDEVAEAGALAVCALGEAYEGDMTAAGGFAHQAAGIVDALPDRDLTGLCEALGRLGWAEAFMNRFADAERHTDRGLAIARRTGQIYLLPHLLLCKAHVRIQTCRLPSALELAEEAEDIARGIGSDELLAFVLGTKTHVLVESCPPGDPRPLATAEEAVTAAAAGPDDNWWASIAWSTLGYAALVSGDPQRARDALLHAGGHGVDRLQPSMRPVLLEILVVAALATGDADSARTWAERARQDAERLALPVQRSAAMRCAGHVAVSRGDTTAAAELFASAAEAGAQCGAVIWEAYSSLLVASLPASPDGGASAEAAWLRGHQLASAGGARMLVGLAETVRPPVTEAATGPRQSLAALTARETEIAEQVAEGLTSQEIAARLYISRRTVETHISRIYRKTGVTSRVALAALVARRTPDRP